MNHISIVGRMVRDPYVNTTGSGIKYVRFTIAVNRKFNKDQTDFIPVVAWRQTAEFVDNYLDKGSLVSIEGSFTSSTYNDKKGEMVTNYEVTAENVTSLETKAMAEIRRETSEMRVKGNAPKFNQPPQFENQNKFSKQDDKDSTEDNSEVPWEIDL